MGSAGRGKSPSNPEMSLNWQRGEPVELMRLTRDAGLEGKAGAVAVNGSGVASVRIRAGFASRLRRHA